MEELNKRLCFTTTSIIRPDILEQTYSSFGEGFEENLKDFDLFLNIDPVPREEDPYENVKVAKNHFGKVSYRIANKPNFAVAVEWCWKHAKTDYIFNLEDDWILNEKVSIKELVEYMDKNQKLLHLSLHKLLGDPRPILGPSIIRREFYSYWSNNFTYKKDPERQIRELGHFNFENRVELYWKGSVVGDNGKVWRGKRRYAKGKTGKFVTYFDGYTCKFLE